MATGSATENAYQFSADEDCVREVTVENTYDHVLTCRKEDSTEKPPEERSKSQTVIKIAFLSTILLVLFGLALCGVLLVSKEKVRLDETIKESLKIRADTLKQQQEVNATWTEKISAVELQIKKTSRMFQSMLHDQMLQNNMTNQKLKTETEKFQRKLYNQEVQHNITRKELMAETKKFQRMLHDQKVQHNLTYQELVADMQEKQRKVNATFMEKISAVQLQVTNIHKNQREFNVTWIKKMSDVDLQVTTMQREQQKGNTTFAKKISRMELLIKETSEKFQLMLHGQGIQNNLTNQRLTEVFNFLLSRHEWLKASNGFYYKVFHNLRNYTDARQQCRGWGARLVSTGFRDPNVREELVNLIKANGDVLWIGANDLEKEGTYVWEDGVASNGRDIDWGNGQPDNAGDEDCLHTYNSAGKVNDRKCSVNYRYICENDVGR